MWGWGGEGVERIACVQLYLLYLFKLLYSRKFLLDKNFTKPCYLCIAEIFDGINFHQYGNGRHMLYVIIYMGQKICETKVSPGGKIGKNFLLAKIFSYTVYECLSLNFGL